MARRKDKKELTKPHPSECPTPLNSQGYAMTPEEQKEEWERKGLCIECGLVQTKKKNIIGGLKILSNGEVYKGICLKCNTLEEAKIQLGEANLSDDWVDVSRTASREVPKSPTRKNIIRSTSGETPGSPISTAVLRLNSIGMSWAVPNRTSSIEDLSPRSPGGGLRDRVDIGGREIIPPEIPRNVGSRIYDLQDRLSEVTLDIPVNEYSRTNDVSHMHTHKGLVKTDKDGLSNHRDDCGGDGVPHDHYMRKPPPEQNYQRHASKGSSGSGIQNSCVADSSLIKMKSKDSGAIPGVVHTSAGRTNIFKQKVEGKTILSQQSSNGDSNIILHRLKSSDSGAESTKPGAVHMPADRTNVYNQKTEGKTSRLQQPPTRKQDGSSGSCTVSAKPGAVHMHPDQTNLFQQKIDKKQDQHQQSLVQTMTNNSSDRNQSMLGVNCNQNETGNSQHCHHHNDNEHCPEFAAQSKLCEMMKARDCESIIEFLRVNSSLPSSIIVFAFKCIRDIVSADFDRSEGSTLFGKISWLKCFAKLMDNYAYTEEIQVEALHTLWAIASFSSHHLEEIMSFDMIESVIDAIDEHQSEATYEHGSGLIACLAMSEEHAISLLHTTNGQVVHRLMSVLTSHSTSGVSHLNALKALCRFSLAFIRSKPSGFFGDEMGQFIRERQFTDCPSADAIDAVLNAMQQHPNQLPLLVEGIRLLNLIFTKDALRDPGILGTLSSKILCHISSILAIHSQNLQLHEALICLLSKASPYGLDLCGEYVSFSNMVLGIMSASSNSSVIGLHGCRCISIVCAGDSKKSGDCLAIASSGGVEAVLKCISSFTEHADIIGEACVALCALCCDVPSNRKHVLESGGLDVITLVFDKIVDSLNLNDIVVCEGWIQACAALMSLSVEPSVRKEIQRQGIIDRFQHTLSGDTTIPERLRSKMQDLVNFVLDNEAGLCAFQSGWSEEETATCLLANLKAISPPNQVDISRAIHLQFNTVSSMKKFPSNEQIQQYGCKILSCIFGLREADRFDGLEEALLCIRSNDPNVVAAAASTFRNFCLAQSLSKLHMKDSECLSNTLLQSTCEFVTAWQKYKTDHSVVEQVLAALLAISTVEEAALLSMESTEFLSLLTECIKNAHLTEARKSCIGLLHKFFTSSVKTVDFLTDNLIVAVLDCLQSDEEDVVNTTINALWIILENGGYPARITMMKNHHEELIGNVVGCMFKFPHSHLIIRASCNILSHISLDDYYYKLAICNSGGTGKVNEALRDFHNDELTTCTALASLTNLISGAAVDVLRLNGVGENILRSMTNHKDALCVQAHGASAIWHLASRSERFKKVLVELGAVLLLSDAMTRFIASESMTTKGLVALWSLSGPVHLKAEVGLYGLVPIVNGISAHLSSKQVCENGIGALKSLAGVIKDMGEENDVMDLIYSCMWLHSESPIIQQVCLGALVNLSVNLDRTPNQVLKINHEDLGTVVTMMRIHQNDEAVQEKAIILLKNFTSSPHNCRIMQENACLVGLVRSAKVNFRDTCEARAEYLLEVLSDIQVDH